MGLKIGYVEFNGTRSDGLGVFVSGAGTFDAAEADCTAYSVPGRNGDVVLFNGRYKNITVEYPAFIPDAFESKVQAVRNWMRSATGYKRLQDNYDASHYRMARGKGVLPFSPAVRNIAANFKLQFDAKPQRFLLTGENETALTTGDTITNPTQYDARPLIKLVNPTASATISVAGSAGTFTLTANAAYTGTVLIDCEIMNIYSGANNLNNHFSGDFPILAPGVSTITFSGVSSASITPRWWEL